MENNKRRVQKAKKFILVKEKANLVNKAKNVKSNFNGTLKLQLKKLAE